MTDEATAPTVPDLDIAPDGRLLLLAPSANRVYSGDAPRLNSSEITLLAQALGVEVRVQPVKVAGIDYLHIESDAADHGLDRLLAEVSGAWALFSATAGAMHPIRLSPRVLYPDDIISIQKYKGKTNEQFTHLLLNVTVALAKNPQALLDGGAHVLDPMCGRGTTLNTCLMRGFDVTGVDLDKSDFDHYQAFITTWLRTHRLKHDLHKEQLRRSGKTYGRLLDFDVAPTREAWKAGESNHVAYLNMDTTLLPDVMRKASVDVIVADTPYGVQHGSHGGALERSPLRLLKQALPAWRTVLRTGGTVGLAYNRHVASPDDMATTLEDAGFTVVQGAGVSFGAVGEDAFRHRVDASIDRDIVVARKA